MSLDLNKGKQGLDLKKSPQGKTLGQGGKQGLDLKKSPHGKTLGPIETPVPAQMKPKGKGKWLLLLLLIPLIAIIWSLSKKGDTKTPTEVAKSNPIEQITDTLQTPQPNMPIVGEADTSVNQKNATDSPGTRKTDSPDARKTDSPDARKTDSPDARKTDSPDARKTEVSSVTPTPESKKTSTNVAPSKMTVNKGRYTRNRTPIDTSNAKEVIHFEFGSFRLDDTSQKLLNDVVSACQSNSATQIRIDGFACNIGSDQANYDVSEARAKTVEQYLRSNGIGSNVKILISAYGSEHPSADNSTSEGRSQNRRAVITYQ